MTAHASRQPDSGTVLIWNDVAEHIRLTDDDAIALVFLLVDLLPDHITDGEVVELSLSDGKGRVDG